MWILPLVGYAGVLIGFAFLTLAIASGLYYLSELVEEHTVSARRLLTRTIYAVVALQLALWLVDGFPAPATALGLGAHLVYLANMRRFPLVQLTDPLFVLACVLVLANHYVWFRHFSSAQASAAALYHHASLYDDVDVPSFTMIAAYFGLCVWLVPFALFVSLSAGDNVLPTTTTNSTDSTSTIAGITSSSSSSNDPIRNPYGNSSANASGNRNRPQAMIKALVDWARGTIGELAASRRDKRF